MLSKDQIEQTLKSLYNREHWKNMLATLFAQQGGKAIWVSDPTEIKLGTKAAAYRSKNLFLLGTITLTDGKTVNVYEAEVQNTKIAQNRVGLRSLVQSEIIPGFNDAALAVFHSPEQTDWRFTFMSKWEYPEDSGKVVKHETHPKKFTYVLGPLESCRTAKDRFYELQAKLAELRSVVDAFSVSKLSEEFFKEYRQHYKAFNDYLINSSHRKSAFNIPKHRDAAENEKAEKPIRDFVKRLLGRIIFLYFVQKKGWMESIWAEPGEVKPDHAFMTHLFQFADTQKDFYSAYLVPLFFKTLNKKRTGDVFKADGKDLGKIPYLNGGLFEEDFKGVDDIQFKNELFEDLFNSFNSYNFTIVEDSPDEREVAVDPEMLGHIFENLIEENKKFGTFYTPKEVVHFMTQEALLLHLSKKLLLKTDSAEWKELKNFVKYKEQNGFVKKQAAVIEAELDSVKVCDPAIGSGAFPMGILLEIFQMKLQIYAMTAPGTSFIPAEVKEKIIRYSIYGVDIDKGAIDIARLRFWLSLIVDLDKPRELPNFDYKFMQGDSLKEEFEGISLKIKEEKPSPTSVDLFGQVNEPESFYGYLNRNNINIEKLEEDLFDAHDEKLKEDARKKLHKTEKAYIKLCIDDQLEELKARIDNEWSDFKRKAARLTGKQKDTLKAPYQKRVDKWEAEKKLFEEKAATLKTLEAYEKPYFLWHLCFKHVFDAGGFDIVIANPPYGVKVDDELYNDSGLGSKDSYGFFIKLAIDTLLKRGGTLVYIVSDTWLTIKTHLELRQLIMITQLHKVVRLHPDTFGAVVNTCIVSLSKQEADEKSQLIATDLTNLSTRKNTPEFREKLWHLEEYIGEFNERYAVYSYPQQLIKTNSNLPVFTASSKLFALMNDVTCAKEKKKIKQGDEEKEVEVRKIKMNNKETELVRFGDVADVKQGLATGDNQYYLYQNPEAHGSYQDINLYKKFLLTEDDLNRIRSNEEVRLKVIEYGMHQTKDEKDFDEARWFDGRYIVPYDKGGESSTDEGWLPNYYVKANYFIDWSTKAVRRLKKYTIAQRIKDRKEEKTSKDHYKTTPAAIIRSPQYYFKSGIAFSRSGQYAPTFRINHKAKFDTEGNFISIPNNYNVYSLLGRLNSKILRYIFKNYIDLTVHFQVEEVKEAIIIEDESDILKKLVEELIDNQKAQERYQYLSKEQKEIDRLVYEMYGLNEEDIQEIEYWWARRYPKLARFADTKPRLSVKDQQELQARLTEAIARGENKYCEFKSSLRWDIRAGAVNKVIEHTAFKNIAAFLNSEGGTLIIGVDDGKNILGLETTDYPTFAKPDKLDEWSKHLDNLIQNYLGNRFHEYLKIHHVQLDDKTVAVIEVSKSSEAAWLTNGSNQEFYIRRTASAIQLSPKEANEYIQHHWKK